MESVIFCPWEPARYFIFSSNVPAILYYAIIPGMIVGLFLGFFVFFKTKKSLAGTALLFICLSFFLWGFFALVLFATNDPQLVMILWSLTILVESLIYAGSVYFSYVFFDGKDLSFWKKGAIFLLLLPIIGLLFTRYNLLGVRLSDCTAIEGIIALYFSYLIEIIFVLWIFLLAIYRYRREGNRDEKIKIALFFSGILFFLLVFSSGNILGSFTSDWVVSQYGYFGMPVFMGLLGYLMVRYQAFNVKVLAVQALVIGLAILIGSQLFFVKSRINFVLTSLTFLFSILFGSMLIRSVKNEIRRKEELQIVTDKLAAANVELKRLDQSKTEFISIASHQLRTPLTAIKGFVSLLLEGSYGKVPAPIADVLDKIYTANDRIVHLVEDLLNISRMESGRLKYEYAEVNIPEFLNELHDTFALVAKKKGLELTFETVAESIKPAWVDRQKAFEVVSNLIDNALKYTAEGSVRVRAEGVPGFVRISVADTGVGIDPDMMPVLFQKFSRGKESGKMHVSGTGLGLYVGKSMIEAQGGHIGVTSEGRDKGSTFFVELPVKQG